MRIIINSSTSTTKFILPSEINAEKITLLSASIPITYYNINNSNNTFIVGDILYTLPVQQYNILTLINTINTLTGNKHNLNMLFNKNTLRISYTLPPIIIPSLFMPPGISFGEGGDDDIVFLPPQEIQGSSTPVSVNWLNLGAVLGLMNNKVYFGNQDAPKMIDLNNRCIYIRSNLATDDVIVLSHSQSEGDTYTDNILYRIGTLGKFGDVIDYKNGTEIALSNVDEVVKSITFTLLDCHFNEIDFNGSLYQLEFYLQTSNSKEFRKDYSILRNDVPLYNDTPVYNSTKIDELIKMNEILLKGKDLKKQLEAEQKQNDEDFNNYLQLFSYDP